MLLTASGVPCKRVHTERSNCNSLGRGGVVIVHAPMPTRPDHGGRRSPNRRRSAGERAGRTGPGGHCLPGWGSHTAFTAGVLGRLLQPDVMADHKIVALSGTSGGAICALLAWSALVDGEPEKAESLLHGFWSDNSASTLPERMLNWWVL